VSRAGFPLPDGAAARWVTRSRRGRRSRLVRPEPIAGDTQSSAECRAWARSSANRRAWARYWRHVLGRPPPRSAPTRAPAHAGARRGGGAEHGPLGHAIVSGAERNDGGEDLRRRGNPAGRDALHVLRIPSVQRVAVRVKVDPTGRGLGEEDDPKRLAIFIHRSWWCPAFCRARRLLRPDRPRRSHDCRRGRPASEPSFPSARPAVPSDRPTVRRSLWRVGHGSIWRSRERLSMSCMWSAGMPGLSGTYEPLNRGSRGRAPSGSAKNPQRLRRRCCQLRGSPQPVYGRPLPRCSGVSAVSAFGFGSGFGFALAAFFSVMPRA